MTPKTVDLESVLIQILDTKAAMEADVQKTEAARDEWEAKYAVDPQVGGIYFERVSKGKHDRLCIFPVTNADPWSKLTPSGEIESGLRENGFTFSEPKPMLGPTKPEMVAERGGDDAHDAALARDVEPA